jgi:hypothetical protein
MGHEMTEYLVKYVRSDLWSLWHERWPLKGEPSQRSIDFEPPWLLSQTEIVKAKNMSDAASIVEKKYPGHRVIRDATVRLG